MLCMKSKLVARSPYNVYVSTQIAVSKFGKSCENTIVVVGAEIATPHTSVVNGDNISLTLS